MSLFKCPNASRSLLRTALRGVTSRASAATTCRSASPRWISGSSLPADTPLTRSLRASRTRDASLTLRLLSGHRRTLFSGDKTITKYEDLPRDYRDQAGLSFRNGELGDAEVLQIFGRGINGRRANQLLRILHGRRVAGTLDDPAFAAHTARFTKDQTNKALEYLRKKVPVEEVLNAGLRAEDELAALEQEAEAAEEQRQTATKKSDKVDKSEEAKPASGYTPDSVYGHSQLDEIRARNIAKQKARELAAEQERKEREARGEAAAGPLAKAGGGGPGRQIANPKIAEYHDKATSDLEAPPELKAWQRILPSATVVALVLGFLCAVTTVYEEPEPRYRLFRDISMSTATVGGLVAANVLVYLAWRAPPLWSLLNRYMIMVVATVKPVTMFTATVSHQSLRHLGMNMAMLWFMGRALHEDLSRAEFLTLYAACGSLGFLGTLTTYTLRGLLGITSMGASGATLGLTAAYFWLHRNDGFRFFGLPEEGVHGIVFLALLLVPQLAAFGRSRSMQIDIASHLVGMATGVLGVEYFTHGRRTEQRRTIVVAKAIPQDGGR